MGEAVSERDYLERTIATVRNHRDADNCWPQWANIFADEIERLWVENAAQAEELRELREALESVGGCQRETVATLRAEGVVFDEQPHRDWANWQQVAFWIY